MVGRVEDAPDRATAVRSLARMADAPAPAHRRLEAERAVVAVLLALVVRRVDLDDRALRDRQARARGVDDALHGRRDVALQRLARGDLLVPRVRLARRVGRLRGRLRRADLLPGERVVHGPRARVQVARREVEIGVTRAEVEGLPGSWLMSNTR